MSTNRTRLGTVVILVCALSCQGRRDRIGSSSALNDGAPPPSFVLRKFAAAEQEDPVPTLVEEELRDYSSCKNADGSDTEFLLRDLAMKTIALSNQDVNAAVDVLADMGYSIRVVNDKVGFSDLVTGDKVRCEHLPIVMLNAEPTDDIFAFEPGTLGSYSSGVEKSEKMKRSHSADVDRLIVFYHPERAESLATLESVISNVIDVPAPQVYIEGWVLEVGEEDSKELGIRFQDSRHDDGQWILGSTSTDGDADVFDFFIDETGELEPDIGVQWRVRALVENGKAEILSRPSLLALSNRQALIQILDVIQSPSQDILLTNSASSTTLKWEEVQIGITLNLRPRVSADRQWVSLEIDAVVDTEDEENTGEAIGIDDDGNQFVLGTKPGFASRRVRTFARIPDRTPIIIGGLVTKEETTIKSRLPGFGDLPGVGGLFGATDKDVTQREIMIILTPYILAEDAIGVASNSPKESELFDETGMALFDDRYRLRAEDLFDLGNVTRTPRFLGYLRKIQRAIQGKPEHQLESHYTEFLGGNFPGGEALVARTFFDLVEKLDLVDELEGNALRVQLEREGSLTAMSFRKLRSLAGDQPIVVRAGSESSLNVYAQIAERPVLAEGEEGVILRDDADADRFRKAAVARELMRVNGGLENLRVRNLKVGQYVVLPSLGENEELAVDLETLRTYENSRSYEKVVFASLEEAYRRIDEDRGWRR